MAGVQCPSPLTGYASGRTNENGKRETVFKRAGSFGDRDIPCGKCDICRAKKARDWGTRAYYESLLHEQNSFLTLTYNDENLPDEVSKRELQLFFKKLRKEVGPIRYLASGEYGDLTGRPHYHAVVFGHDFLGGAHRIGESWHLNPVVTEIWGKGNVQCMLVDPGACYYVAGYAMKKLGEKREFQIYSTKPPIGKKACQKWKSDFMNGYAVIEGKKVPVPKAFREWDPEIDEACKKAFKKPALRQRLEERKKNLGRYKNVQYDSRKAKNETNYRKLFSEDNL